MMICVSRCRGNGLYWTCDSEGGVEPGGCGEQVVVLPASATVVQRQLKVGRSAGRDQSHTRGAWGFAGGGHGVRYGFTSLNCRSGASSQETPTACVMVLAAVSVGGPQAPDMPEVPGHHLTHGLGVPGDQRVHESHVLLGGGREHARLGQRGQPVQPRTIAQVAVPPPRGGVARQAQQGQVEGPVGLDVGDQVAGLRAAVTMASRRAAAPAGRSGRRRGKAGHHRHLDQGPDVGEWSRSASDSRSPGSPCSGRPRPALLRQLEHRLAHRRRRHPEAGGQHRRGVHHAGPQLARDQGGAQGVRDLFPQRVWPSSRGRFNAGPRRVRTGPGRRRPVPLGPSGMVEPYPLIGALTQTLSGRPSSTNPAGNGSLGSSRYWAVPVTQARPVMVGSTAGRPGRPSSRSTSAADEAGADERLVDEVVPQRQLAAGVQLGHPGARAGAAGRAVEPAGVDGHRVPRVLRPSEPGASEVDVVAAADLGRAAGARARLLR